VWTASAQHEAKQKETWAPPLETVLHPSGSLPRRPFSDEPGPHIAPIKPAGGSGIPKHLSAQSQLWDRTHFRDLKVIGQYQDIYIVCESNEDLILLDQHAAHERILYEKLTQSRNVKTESQGLLIPETIDLNYREAAVLDKLIPELSAIGFEIEPFGGDTFVIKSVPALLGEREIKSLVVEMVEKWIEDGSGDVAEKAMDDGIKLIACHGAIRANQRITDMEIKAMLEQLDACENPSNCPHGRPTWIKLERAFFEKAFKRMV
jgi:DNA mismatch repair protein MutL